MTVYVSGLGVMFDERADAVYARAHHWRMLELFVEQLRAPWFGGIRVFGSGEAYDVPVPSAFRVTLLNDRPFSRFGRLRGMPQLYQRLYRDIRECDYVFARIPAWSGLAAARVARVLGKPCIVSVHGHWDSVFSKQATARRLYNQALAAYVSRQTRSMLRQARHVFFVGHTLARAYGDCTSSATVFANHLHAAADVLEPRVSPTEGRRRILYVGELTHAKGLEVLRRAFVRLRRQALDAELALVGVGPEEETMRAFGQSDPLLRDRVLLRGWRRAGQELDAEYAAADVFVLPSLAEGVPKVVIEAMAHGVPVVASGVGDVPEILGHGARGWVVPPGDETALAEALGHCLRSPGAALARAEAAAPWVRAHDRAFYARHIREALASSCPELVIP